MGRDIELAEYIVERLKQAGVKQVSAAAFFPKSGRVLRLGRRTLTNCSPF